MVSASQYVRLYVQVFITDRKKSLHSILLIFPVNAPFTVMLALCSELPACDNICPTVFLKVNHWHCCVERALPSIVRFHILLILCPMQCV